MPVEMLQNLLEHISEVILEGEKFHLYFTGIGQKGTIVGDIRTSVS